ncbi:MAG: hypothetical protein ACOC7Y_03325, partial [Chloroflexota bacterium]
MRSITLLALIVILLSTQACAPMPTAEPTPTLPPSAATGERHCGDGVCDGPENADNCPEDCGAGPAATPTPVPPTAESEEEGQSASAGSVPPVYVTVAGHIEDTPIYARCEAYPRYREKLLQWAEGVHAEGAAVNLQIDYEFFLGASRCETTELADATTAGENVIHYLATHLGFEIDPHQEGGWEEGADNYADVRFLGGSITPFISDNVGGLVWDDPEQFQRLSQGEAGRIHTDFTWTPDIVTLAVSRDHHLGDFSADDVASGVWRPAGAGEDFWIHDPNGRLVYVGPGERSNWDSARPDLSTPQFVSHLARQLHQGALDRNRMYTASIPVPQSIIFNPERHGELLSL